MVNGIPFERVTNPSRLKEKLIQCTKCRLIMNNPVLCGKCTNHFCYQCLKESLLSSETCPFDNQRITRIDIKRPDSKVVDHMKEIYAVCQYDNEKEMTLLELAKHEKICPDNPNRFSRNKSGRLGSANSFRSGITDTSNISSRLRSTDKKIGLSGGPGSGFKTFDYGNDSGEGKRSSSRKVRRTRMLAPETDSDSSTNPKSILKKKKHTSSGRKGGIRFEDEAIASNEEIAKSNKQLNKSQLKDKSWLTEVLDKVGNRGEMAKKDAELKEIDQRVKKAKNLEIVPPKHKIESQTFDYRTETLGQSGMYKKMPIIIDQNVNRDLQIDHTKTSVAYNKFEQNQRQEKDGFWDLRSLKGRKLHMYPYNSIDGETPLYFRTRDQWYKHPAEAQSTEDIDDLSKKLGEVQLVLQGMPLHELNALKQPNWFDWNPRQSALYDAEKRHIEQLRMLRDGLQWQQNRIQKMQDANRRGYRWTEADDLRLAGHSQYGPKFDQPGAIERIQEEIQHLQNEIQRLRLHSNYLATDEKKLNAVEPYIDRQQTQAIDDGRFQTSFDAHQKLLSKQISLQQQKLKETEELLTTIEKPIPGAPYEEREIPSRGTSPAKFQYRKISASNPTGSTANTSYLDWAEAQSSAVKRGRNVYDEINNSYRSTRDVDVSHLSQNRAQSLPRHRTQASLDAYDSSEDEANYSSHPYFVNRRQRDFNQRRAMNSQYYRGVLARQRSAYDNMMQFRRNIDAQKSKLYGIPSEPLLQQPRERIGLPERNLADSGQKLPSQSSLIYQQQAQNYTDPLTGSTLPRIPGMGYGHLPSNTYGENLRFQDMLEQQNKKIEMLEHQLKEQQKREYQQENQRFDRPASDNASSRRMPLKRKRIKVKVQPAGAPISDDFEKQFQGKQSEVNTMIAKMMKKLDVENLDIEFERASDQENFEQQFKAKRADNPGELSSSVNIGSGRPSPKIQEVN